MPTSSFGAIRVPIVDDKGMPQRDFLKKLQEYEAKLQSTITLVGQIAKNAVIQGRTEGIGTTVQNMTATGQLNTFTNVAAGRTTDNLSDGTGSPLTGGKRGFLTINTNNQIASTNNGIPAHSNGAFAAGANPLSQVGTSTAIAVAGWTMQFGEVVVGVTNPGSVDPGVLGSWFVYYDNPSFVLTFGSVTYFATQSTQTVNGAYGRICLGKITTVGGGGGAGSGTGGGGVSGIRALL